MRVAVPVIAPEIQLIIEVVGMSCDPDPIDLPVIFRYHFLRCLLDLDGGWIEFCLTPVEDQSAALSTPGYFSIEHSRIVPASGHVAAIIIIFGSILVSVV